MTTDAPRPPGAPGAGDGGLALLTGPDAGDLLAAAVASDGGEVLGWRARQVDHRPGGSTTVSYRARVRWPDGERFETLAATTGVPEPATLPDGVLVVGAGDRRVAVWRFPVDPGLPALAAASEPRGVAALLASVGLPGEPAGADVEVQVRSYRPRRRAVLEARSAAGRLFLKVVRPSAVENLHRRHVLLHDAGVPVPRSLAWTEQGLLVLQALPGTGMRERMRTGGALPAGRDLLAVLDALPAAVLELPRRTPWAEHAAHYARVVGAAVPHEAPRATQLADRVAAGLDGVPADEPTHGDFYEAQLLLDGARVSGLLDVDTAGPGRRADDLACLLAHAQVLALVDGDQSERLHAVSGLWLRDADRAVDPVELRYRVAGVLMSLATGPHRVQERGWVEGTRARLDLVERWVDAATATATGVADGRPPVVPARR
ncbi:phosphotransferase [Thalassiella azotivora]